MGIMAAFLPVMLGATIDVPAGGDLATALDLARPGDVIRLAAGVHRGSMGRRRGPLRIEGAGSEVTEVRAPEGEDGLVVEGGDVAISGIAIRTGPARAGLKVLGGAVTAEGVALLGGAVGAFVQDGRLAARDLDVAGGYGLLVRSGRAAITGGSARGDHAGVALLGGGLELRRVMVTGPSVEAGITVSGGEAVLEAVVIRSPGPSGLAVAGAETQVAAFAMDVVGTQEAGGALGSCVQVRRGTLRLAASNLTRCAGAALEASGGTLDIRGVDAAGGSAGCLVLVEGARAELVGNRCEGSGPAVVAASGARAAARMNRWRTDPVLWVDCGSGARVEVGAGERVAEPCRKR